MPTNTQPPLWFAIALDGRLTMLAGRETAALAASGWQIGAALATLTAHAPAFMLDVQRVLVGEELESTLTFNQQTWKVHLTPLYHPDLSIQGAAGVVVDTQLLELKDRFISLVSHRFRNPLTIINTTVFLLERHHDKLDAAKKAEYFGKVRTQIHYLNDLIEQVLTVYGKTELVYEPTQLDLTMLCEQIAIEMQASLPSSHTLAYEIQEGVNLVGDVRLLTRIIKQLLQNAEKFSPDGGLIRLELSAQPEQVVINIHDPGIGIPADEQPHIGEAHHRARNATHFPGSGLGLRIVQLCLNKHQGRLSFTSVEGQGSTFTITLPIR